MNQDTILTIQSFPTKAEVIENINKRKISNFLTMIKNKIYESTTNSITLTMDDITPYLSIKESVFYSLINEKNFLIIRNITHNPINEIITYNISWEN